MSEPTTEALRARLAELVFGRLDAHTDEKIGGAILDGLRMSDPTTRTATVEWNGNEHKVEMLDAFNVGAPGNAGHGLAWWRIREGKPWQADIEAHVKAWRDPMRGWTPERDIAQAFRCAEAMRARARLRDEGKTDVTWLLARVDEVADALGWAIDNTDHADIESHGRAALAKLNEVDDDEAAKGDAT